VWCGAECPGTAADTPSNWSTSLAGVRVDEAKLKAGSLDDVGRLLHCLLDEIPSYSVTHAVWLTEQVPGAGASLTLASALMRLIKWHHGLLSIVTKLSDTLYSPWVNAMKASVLFRSDVHKLAVTISKCCWVGDILLKGGDSDMNLSGVLVQGQHTNFVTNSNLTTLKVLQVVQNVPLYLLKECVDVTSLRKETATLLSTLTNHALLCRVLYQKEQVIKLKSEWIRAVQTRSVGGAVPIQGPNVLLWRGKIYTFRDTIQSPHDITMKGGNVSFDQERRILEVFERSGSSEHTNNKAFPVKIPSPRATPALASVPTPQDILAAWNGEVHSTEQGDREMFDQARAAKMCFSEARKMNNTHGIHYYEREGDDQKMQQIQKNYVHRETYSCLSLHNKEEASKSTFRPADTRTKRSSQGKPDEQEIKMEPSGSSTGKTKLNKSVSLTNLTQKPAQPTDTIEHTKSKSADNISTKPSRSSRNKTMLKTVITEELHFEGVEDVIFKSCQDKLYGICKVLLKDMTSDGLSLKDTMKQIVEPQAKIVIMLERQKQLAKLN